MRLSTRGIYGLRAVLALAQGYGGRPMMVKEIADRERLPAAYLEQLMVSLRKSGLVYATRGSHGGYTLTRSPAQITLGDVVIALEGPLQLAESSPLSSYYWQPEGNALKTALEEASRHLVSFLEKITLADIVQRQSVMTASSAAAYEI